jgi:hypothetical protein
MNGKQSKVCWVALGLFCLSLLAVPVVTFNGSWTGSHVVGGIQYIPFIAVSSSQKVRMDILSIEWIGVGVITILLYILLRGTSTNGNQSRTKQIFKKILKILAIILAVLAILGSALYGVQSYIWHLEKSYINSSELSFSGVELASENKNPEDPKNPFSDLIPKSFTLRGSITNNSKEYKVKYLKIKVLILDNLPNGNIEEMASDDVILCWEGGYNDKLPAGQTKSFNETIYFKNFPHPYGKVTWTYRVVEILGERDTHIASDPSVQRVNPIPTNYYTQLLVPPPQAKGNADSNQKSSGMIDDLMKTTNSKSSIDPFADLPDKDPKVKK